MNRAERSRKIIDLEVKARFLERQLEATHRELAKLEEEEADDELTARHAEDLKIRYREL